MKDAFSTFHPIVNFTYFTVVIVLSMFFMDPILMGIGLISALVYSSMLKGRKAVKFNLVYMLPLLLFMSILNPLFNHQGMTILFYMQDGNPITLESIIYGVSSACMFVTTILWFSCYNIVMTSDKFIYLFGKIMPALSLIFSMVLRFVPRYTAKIKAIKNAQKCVGRDISQGKILKRAKNGIKILSIMTTWALENAIETADSMKSRGYGLPGRTSFSLFRFDSRDKIIITLMLGLLIATFSFASFAAYFLLCMLPVIINITEEMKWKSIKSRT